MAITRSYGLDPDFERVVAYYAACSLPFWSMAGRFVEPALLALVPARRVFETIRQMSLERAVEGVTSATTVLQRLRRLREAGKITHEDVEEVRALFFAVCDELPCEADVLAELAPVLKQQRRWTHLEEGSSLLSQKKDFEGLVKKIVETEKIGTKSLIEVSARVQGSSERVGFIGEMDKLPLGIIDLDYALDGGVQRPSFVVILGSSGDGKSMMLIHAAASAYSVGCFVGYASLELTTPFVIARFLSNVTGELTDNLFYNRALRDKAFVRFDEIQAQCAGDFACTYMPARGASVTDIIAWVDREQEATGRKMDVLAVDYLQLLAASTKGKARRDEELTEASEQLRGFANDRKMLILAPSQTTADGMDKKKVKRLEQSHTAQSKGIPQTADFLLSLNVREEGITFHVGKSRNGRQVPDVGPLPTEYARARIVPVTWPWETAAPF